MTTSALRPAWRSVCAASSALLGLPLGVGDQDAAALRVAGQRALVLPGAPQRLIPTVSGVLRADDPLKLNQPPVGLARRTGM